jgi:caspase domain-containing protein
MNVSRTTYLRSVAIFGILSVAFLSTSGARSAPEASTLHSPAGEARALVIGIDAYRFGQPLKGAVADARDIEASLRLGGASDVTELLDAAADRTTVMRSIDQLLSRSQSGDLVILSIAGRGAREPEHFKGSQPDGQDDVFILSGFDPRTADGAQQRILGSEFNHLIRQFTEKGAQVLFIIDAGYGGGTPRTIDPRAAEMSYRQAPSYAIAHDTLQPISTARDVSLSGDGLERVTVLAASEGAAAAPEVPIPGESTLRGALSYAVARALEGAADENHDGHITRDELFRYVSQVAYQLSDQRQQVSAHAAAQSSEAGILYARTRGVVLLDPLPRSEPRPQSSSSPAAATLTPSLPRPVVSPQPASVLDTVRIAVVGNQKELLKELQPKYAHFQPVTIVDHPDLIWDSATLDVLAGGDVIAHQIKRKDLPNVIDWFAAVNGFKRLAAKSPQTVRVLPSDKVHSRGSRIEVQVSGVAQRSLLLFNMNGDGTVQVLYPVGSDPLVLSTPDYKFSVVVGEPFGADQVVAVTSAQPMNDLKQVLNAINQQSAAVEVYRAVERYAPPDARIGATSLYTAP